ncbi:HIT family protein [Polynucleobacter sp. 30F-ANTBAC]|jgi:diadenosine tetraphosphate (Ap4A) HIT family hydrolase|uniref:HIT family protein n=1 Tax=Polynucleobacter sp. 30F-ANTBAC TaxID=2689095 RepID=UPI001C0C2996|nr:HIT family protein [Polynucleobacter sp. 30F-ANTBAC]MBU3599273.1 HIT family protein [Polynucleobacter sp. 30F-ANTBAC]
MNSNCPLCTTDGGELLWKNDEMRVIFANEPDYPGFCRVIWNEHVAEMSQLSVDQRARLHHIVMLVEKAIIDVMHPDKVNLAALGNMVPHLHWHIIPRYQLDVCFPGSVWSEKLRPSNQEHLIKQQANTVLLKKKIQDVLGVL